MQRMALLRRLMIVAVCCGGFLGFSLLLPTAQACPFCGVAQMTLSEQLASSDAAVLVQWAGGKKGDDENPGNTSYEIKQIVKAPKSVGEAGAKIVLDRYRPGKAGDLFFILGTDTGSSKGVEWGSPLEVTETSFNYMAQAPSPEAPQAKRLAYFVKFLEFSDPTIANDAFGEIANAQYKDVAALKPVLSVESLRKWVTSKETPATRLGLYGMLLGLCGDETDAKLLEKRILIQTDEFRLGIDGLMGGYLMIRGDKGLDLLDEEKLRNTKAPFSEIFATMQALRFMWTYGDGRISPERLRQSMRILLDRPEMADLVIADLARWKDWSVTERLLQLYGNGEYNVPSIKRAVVRYMLVASKDLPQGGGQPIPEHVTQAKAALEKLRKEDPKTVTEAERFFILP